jgi:FixJ family two-component response regulator
VTEGASTVVVRELRNSELVICSALAPPKCTNSAKTAFNYAVTTENVYVIEHDASSRAALCQCLRASGFVVRAFGSVESILERRPLRVPACVVLDYDLPGLSGPELQRQLLDDSALAIVFVTGRGDVATVVEAMKGGAVDFLTKPVDTERLVAAVTRGLEQSARTEAERRLHHVFLERVDRLTPLEREVATRLVRGLLDKRIAADLGTTEKTIKVHRARVMTKLEVGSVTELVRLVENASRPDVSMVIGSAARSAADKLLETRRIHSARSQPKWRSTC